MTSFYRWENFRASSGQHRATSASVTALADIVLSQKAVTPRVQAPASTSAPSPADEWKRTYIDASPSTGSIAFGAAKTQGDRTSKRGIWTSGPMIWLRLCLSFLKARRFV